MNPKVIQSVTYRLLLLFIIGFILILPNSYYLLPDLGNLLRPITEPIGNRLLGSVDHTFYSDSTIMFVWIVVLLIGCALLSIIWTIIKKETSENLFFWLHKISSYYLSLTLFIYGFNKLFKYQFFYPEPNTLYTPLGELTPDILFWSSMGTSYSYSVFAGIIEILPAILLLFRKTRMLGAFIAFGVLANVTMINFGFGITVKAYSLFLILLCLVTLLPYLPMLIAFFLKENQGPNKSNIALAPIEQDSTYKRFYPILKPLLIGLIIIESLGMYFESGQFNGDSVPKPPMYGAYSVESNEQGIAYIFFHSKGYFITRTHSGIFMDYPYSLKGTSLILTDYGGRTCEIKLQKKGENNFEINGDFYGVWINWYMTKIPLTK